jgi:vacuolar-type H+-ATPase subunit E/Vma4
MALQHILDAIVAEADRKIDEIQSAHKQRMKEMREQSDRAVTQKKRQINDQLEQRKRQMQEKAASHARMLRSKSLLAKKQECMDSLYANVLEKLSSLPKDKLEVFLKACLERLDGEGTIYPAKPHEAIIKKLAKDRFEIGEPIDALGGFRFESRKIEHDFTFEFIVHSLLRPQTEVAIADDLFPASHS